MLENSDEFCVYVYICVNRCGEMSQSCERFFVQEACFYECDVNIGLWRVYNDPINESNGENSWQIFGMPIKASYCNAWYNACYNDYFCGNGSYFECARLYNEFDNISILQEEVENKINTGLVVGLIVAAIIVIILCISVVYIISRERNGKPMFIKELMEDTETNALQ